jgi:hypothetical protein
MCDERRIEVHSSGSDDSDSAAKVDLQGRWKHGLRTGFWSSASKSLAKAAEHQLDIKSILPAFNRPADFERCDVGTWVPARSLALGLACLLVIGIAILVRLQSVRSFRET